jgi:PDZ domain
MLTLPLINCMIGNKSNRWDDGLLLPYSNKAFSHSKHEVLLSVLLLSVIVFSVLFLRLPFAEGLIVDYNPNIGEGKTINHSSFLPIQIHNFGAWMSNQIPLESLPSYDARKGAIGSLLEQGYNEYYFLISNYKSKDEQSKVEDLLNASDNTPLRMIAILMPPSEGGENGNYNWNGWINYLNLLKDKHSSLYGFVIDDFNWFSSIDEDNGKNRKDHHDVNLKENVDFMIKSHLDKALQNKRKDLYFFPVLYFEGMDTNDVKKSFYNYSNGIILASSEYYNVTDLQHNLNVFSKVFYNKPIRYVIYTTRTTSFIKQDYSPPSDRLILATLSIANKAHGIDGIIAWRNTNNHVMSDYMSNTNNTQYLSFVSMMEDFQLRDEKKMGETNGAYSSIVTQPPLPPQDKNNNNDNDKNNSKMANTPSLGILGFDLTSPTIAKDMRLPEDYKGVVIQSVVPNSPAAKAGLNGTILDVDDNGYLIRKGDVITSIDGNKIEKITDIIKQMEKKKAGDLLDVIINRNGVIFHKSIMLQPIPRL